MNKFLIIPILSRLDESLELAKEYGFGFEYNDFFHPNVLDDEAFADDIISSYKAHELPDICTMHGDFFDVLVFSEDRYIREISEKRVFQSMELAVKTGVKGVVFHTNHNPAFHAEAYVSNWLDRNEAFWKQILEKYPDTDVYIENMCDDSPVMLGGLAERLCGYKNFGVCLDYAHANIFGGDAQLWIEKLYPYIKHMHINDNDLKDDLHLAVGSGKIDWNSFREQMKRFDDITVLIETSSIEAQRASAEFLRSLGMI